MIHLVQMIILILFVAISFWGWGRLSGKLLYGSFHEELFYPVVLGLAVVAILGGVCNALGIANLYALWTIIGTGWLLAAISLRTFSVYDGGFPWVLLLFTSFIVVLIFLVATLMPSYTLNYHDDFHTYLARPVRMLQTGSLYGGWFDLLGLDSLGGQAFFQGLFLLTLPIEYINGFDGVFCAALSVGMAGDLARRLNISPLYAVTAMASLILINPQTVNVSTLYSGVVVIQGLIFSVLLWGDAMATRVERNRTGSAIAIGLLLGVLLVLKLTLVIYALAFFLLWLAAALIYYQRKKTVFVSALVVSLAAFFTLIPWITMHRDNMLTALSQFISGKVMYENDGGVPWPGLSSLLANQESFYGGGFIDYAFLIAFLLLMGVIAGVLLLRRSPQLRAAVYLVPLFAVSMATVLVYLINPYITDTETAIRYSCPLIIAAIPFSISVMGKYIQLIKVQKHNAGLLTRPDMIVCVLTIFSLSVMFSDAFKQRIVRLVNQRTLISFPISVAYENFSKNALSSDSKRKIMQAQLSTEPGEGVLTWVSQPYHLDFLRNHIVAASEPSLLVPWLDLPKNDTEKLRTYLLSHGVRYVIWEAAGPGIKNPREFLANLSSPYPLYRRLARRALSFLAGLRDLAKNSSLVYEKKPFVVMDLGQGNKKIPETEKD